MRTLIQVGRVASVILPMFDNAGASLADTHSDFRRDLREAFGAYSETLQAGEWESGGIVYRDESTVYSVAAQWTPDRFALFCDIAATYCDKARQLAVMVTDAQGESFLIEASQAAPASLTYSAQGAAMEALRDVPMIDSDESQWERARGRRNAKRERDESRRQSRQAKAFFRYA